MHKKKCVYIYIYRDTQGVEFKVKAMLDLMGCLFGFGGACRDL